MGTPIWRHYLLLLLIGLLPAVGQASVSMTVCSTSYNNMPFAQGVNAVAGDPPGILDEIIHLAAAELDTTIKKVFRPWNRCLHLLQTGEVDVVTGVGWTGERADNFVFPPDREQYVWRGSYPIFVKQGTKLTWDGRKFGNLDNKLSAPLGYQASDKLRLLGALVSGPLPPERAMLMIAHERLDGYVIEENIGWQFIDQLRLREQLTVLPERFMSIAWYAPVSSRFYQEQTALVESLWQRMAEIRVERRSYFVDRYQLIQH